MSRFVKCLGCAERPVCQWFRANSWCKDFPPGGMLPSCYFARAIYQFFNGCWGPCTVFPWIERNQHGMFHEATSNALLAATISLLLVLFVTLSCIDDKQVAPSNDMSLDRSPMHLGERRMGVQVENWCSECDAVREMLSSRAGHITVITVYIYIVADLKIEYSKILGLEIEY